MDLLFIIIIIDELALRAVVSKEGKEVRGMDVTATERSSTCCLGGRPSVSSLLPFFSLLFLYFFFFFLSLFSLIFKLVFWLNKSVFD